MRRYSTATAGPDTSSQQGWGTPNQTTEVLPQSTAKKLIGLSWHLACQERFDEADLGLERLAMQTLMLTMDSIQPHWIASISSVLLESPNPLMSSQYLCGTSRLDTSHIIHDVCRRVGSGDMHCM